jgi:PKD repeat protein
MDTDDGTHCPYPHPGSGQKAASGGLVTEARDDVTVQEIGGRRVKRAIHLTTVLVLLCSVLACASKDSDSSAPGTGGGILHADFSATPRSGDPPLEVQFTNTSSGKAATFFWDFGDGATSAEENPAHTYSTEGSYTVTLAIAGPGGSDTETKVAYITCGNPPGPTVDFEGTPTSGDAPLTVDFIDLTTGSNVHAWEWGFGDGETSTDRNPTHTYAAPGTYDVSLAATDDNGSLSLTKPGYVEVTDGGGSSLVISPSPHKPAGTDAAVEKALAYLDARGGLWPTSNGEEFGQLVITAFCGLALMASGSTPDSGPYKDSIKTAADHLAANIDFDGSHWGSLDQSNWIRTIGPLFLAEAYHASGNTTYKKALQKAATLLADGQEPSWGYGHGPHVVCYNGYLEITVMSNYAIMAMGLAKACGCSVDQTALENAVNYLPKSTLTSGGVAYAHNYLVDAHPCRTGGAIMALNLSTFPESSYAGLESKMTTFLQGTMSYIPYGHGSGAMGYLNGALGCLCAGQNTWDNYVKGFFARILSTQRSDGSFPAFDGEPGANSDPGVGIYYTTGINTLILQLDLNNLHFLRGR